MLILIAIPILIESDNYPLNNRTFSEVRERINTPDGDFLDLDFVSFKAQDESVTSKCTAKKATVVILHGLESNTKGPLVTKMTNAFLSKGFSCCLVSFRGCSGEDNLTRGAYHVGFTKDVDLVCKTLQERYLNLLQLD